MKNNLISLESLKIFQENYMKNQNFDSDNKLKEMSIQDFTINEDVIKENKFDFNLELEECKIYSQKSSLRCWLFSCLNLIKNNVAHNMNCNPLDFQISANYLTFYDKLEKSNHAYQVIIDSNYNFRKNGLVNKNKNRFLAEFLQEPVRETGRIEYARELIKKYGIVPEEIMPETYNSSNSAEFIKLFSQKVRKDLFLLIEAKNEKKDLFTIKNKMLYENYTILCKVLGTPPTIFNYTYRDQYGKKHNIDKISPQEFYKKYSSINLDDFVLIGNVPMKNFPYYSKFRKAYSGNIEGESFIEFINLPQKEFVNLIVLQLKSNIPVCFACENKKYRNKESTILDTRLFNFEKHFGIKDMNKKQALESFDITLKHWMTFKGCQIEDGKVIRWKVEDSAGEEQRTRGYYVMNNNFFEKCVFQAWINKKFLNKDYFKILNKKPILFGYNEPI